MSPVPFCLNSLQSLSRLGPCSKMCFIPLHSRPPSQGPSEPRGATNNPKVFACSHETFATPNRRLCCLCLCRRGNLLDFFAIVMRCHLIDPYWDPGRIYGCCATLSENPQLKLHFIPAVIVLHYNSLEYLCVFLGAYLIYGNMQSGISATVRCCSISFTQASKS